MARSKWLASTRGTAGLLSILTTQLDALANDAGVITPTIPNETLGDKYADFELVATYASAPTADRTVDLYVVRTIDGTNFEDASATRPTPEWVGAFVLSAVGTQQRDVVRGVLLPPRDFRLLVVNKSGVALTASGHTLRGYFYNDEIV